GSGLRAAERVRRRCFYLEAFPVVIAVHSPRQPLSAIQLQSADEDRLDAELRDVLLFDLRGADGVRAHVANWGHDDSVRKPDTLRFAVASRFHAAAVLGRRPAF